MLCLAKSRSKPLFRRPTALRTRRNTVRQQTKERSKRLQYKKQVNAPPDDKMRELLEDIMEALASMMYDGYDWITEQEIVDEILGKQTSEEIKEQEVMDALECGRSFGLILKSSGQYSLPKKVYTLIEEGSMPDWTEYYEDWPKKPRKVRKSRRKKRQRRRR